MEGERKRSKGSIFHFFDWNGKSRKKLFLNNSELAEGSKQGKENVENMATSQLHAIEINDRRANSSNRGSSDFSCASSITSDEGYGTRAPGVVARLMGLDSLPISNVAETSPTPSFISSNNPNLWSEYNPMDYLNIPCNQVGYSWNSLEARSQKVQSRPIERFQTEILPPKSAKSIPITHHKLLSPIKNPGFIPKKNAAYVIEAAAKIIEASPKATMNVKVPSIGSSSVPMRIQDLKRKMKAAHTASRPQRSNELFTTKNTKGQHSGRSQNGSEGMSSCKASTFSETGDCDSLRNKAKSASLGVQAKSSVQRREVATSSNTNIKKQKDIRSNQLLKSSPNTLKTKRTESRTSNVLKQNNQKQNCISGKESSTSKKSVSNQSGRKPQSMSNSNGQSRTLNKAVLKPETMSRKMRSLKTDSEKEKRIIVSKNQSVNGDLQIGIGVSDNLSFNRDDRSIKCNVAVDESMNSAVENMKNGMDVVSFTFSSPVKRTTLNDQQTMMGKTNCNAIDSFGINDHPHLKKSSPSFPGLNIIGGDALGVLLEQKLLELTSKVEGSQCNLISDQTSASSTSSLQNSVSTLSVVSTIPAAQDRSYQLVEKDNSDYLDDFDCFSLEDPRVTENQKWQFQGSEEMEEHSCSRNFSKAEKDPESQSPSPVSILEPSFESGSCSNANVQSDEVLNDFSTIQSLEVEGETELSDSASSISTVDVGRKHIIRTFITTEFNESSDWELDYVRDVLNNAELKLKDFAFGQNSKVITPNLFHQLEDQYNRMKRNEEDYSKLEQKILFDCVSERLDLMCEQTFVGSCKLWAKFWTLFQRKGWLAEELYKEISGWKSMGDLMVDELVDKDMSTRYGKWLDFNIEAFEEGIEIEKGILTSLVDELVSDLFIL